jgi:hypothetical protein
MGGQRNVPRWKPEHRRAGNGVCPLPRWRRPYAGGLRRLTYWRRWTTYFDAHVERGTWWNYGVCEHYKIQRPGNWNTAGIDDQYKYGPGSKYATPESCPCWWSEDDSLGVNVPDTGEWEHLFPGEDYRVSRDGKNQNFYEFGFHGPFVSLSIQSSYSEYADIFWQGTSKCSEGWYLYDRQGGNNFDGAVLIDSGNKGPANSNGHPVGCS